MLELNMGVVEGKFADMIWENEPVRTAELVKMTQKSFGWKKTTCYTVLKRLCDKGIFENNNGNVSSLVSKNEFYSRKSELFVNEEFDGSLPAFLAAFTSRKKLTQKEAEYLRKMIAEYEEK